MIIRDISTVLNLKCRERHQPSYCSMCTFILVPSVRCLKETVGLRKPSDFLGEGRCPPCMTLERLQQVHIHVTRSLVPQKHCRCCFSLGVYKGEIHFSDWTVRMLLEWKPECFHFFFYCHWWHKYRLINFLVCVITHRHIAETRGLFKSASSGDVHVCVSVRYKWKIQY